MGLPVCVEEWPSLSFVADHGDGGSLSLCPDVPPPVADITGEQR